MFRRPDSRTRTVFGYTFQLTEHHLTPEQMDPMKRSYDTLGEKALERLDSISSQLRSTLPRNSIEDDVQRISNPLGMDEKPTEGKRDLYVQLRQNYFNDEVLGQLWAEVNAVPSWVCWDQIARGQDCFYRYGGPVLTGLAFQSLLGGMVNSFGLLF